MASWQFVGDETEGVIIGEGGERYRCRLENGQVQVSLPWRLNQEHLRTLLGADGWAVAWDHDEIDSLGWGPQYDVEGYYPYWVRSDKQGGGTVFAFPPQDYRVGQGKVIGPKTDSEVAEELTGAGESHQSEPRSHEPVLGSKALQEFARWISYLNGSALQDFVGH